MRISKKVIPRDQRSDLRVSCWRPRARSGDKYYRTMVSVHVTTTMAEVLDNKGWDL